jgi:hypothetical protein
MGRRYCPVSDLPDYADDSTACVPKQVLSRRHALTASTRQREITQIPLVIFLALKQRISIGRLLMWEVQRGKALHHSLDMHSISTYHCLTATVMLRNRG